MRQIQKSQGKWLASPCCYCLRHFLLLVNFIWPAEIEAALWKSVWSMGGWCSLLLAWHGRSPAEQRFKMNLLVVQLCRAQQEKEFPFPLLWLSFQNANQIAKSERSILRVQFSMQMLLFQECRQSSWTHSLSDSIQFTFCQEKKNDSRLDAHTLVQGAEA